MDIVGMFLEIIIVTNQMFPISPLPDPSFAFFVSSKRYTFVIR